jgi:hypothetical protein
MMPSTRAPRLALLGATVLTAAVLTASQVSNADGSASPAAAAKSKIAYLRSSEGGYVGLYVVNADRTRERRLLETGQGDPAIPPSSPRSPPGRPTRDRSPLSERMVTATWTCTSCRPTGTGSSG